MDAQWGVFTGDSFQCNDCISLCTFFLKQSSANHVVGLCFALLCDIGSVLRNHTFQRWVCPNHWETTICHENTKIIGLTQILVFARYSKLCWVGHADVVFREKWSCRFNTKTFGSATDFWDLLIHTDLYVVLRSSDQNFITMIQWGGAAKIYPADEPCLKRARHGNVKLGMCSNFFVSL